MESLGLVLMVDRHQTDVSMVCGVGDVLDEAYSRAEALS